MSFISNQNYVNSTFAQLVREKQRLLVEIQNINENVLNVINRVDREALESIENFRNQLATRTQQIDRINENLTQLTPPRHDRRINHTDGSFVTPQMATQHRNSIAARPLLGPQRWGAVAPLRHAVEAG